jgi:hypothetical protein
MAEAAQELQKRVGDEKVLPRFGGLPLPLPMCTQVALQGSLTATAGAAAFREAVAVPLEVAGMRCTASSEVSISPAGIPHGECKSMYTCDWQTF